MRIRKDPTFSEDLILRIWPKFAKSVMDKFTVCNFQSMKSPLELSSLFSKFLCYFTWLLCHLIRRDFGRLTNEVFTSDPIVSLKQQLSGLITTSCLTRFGPELRFYRNQPAVLQCRSMLKRVNSNLSLVVNIVY